MINMTDKLFDYKIQQGFLWSEVNLKGEKKYYVEGYASTIDEDKAGEIINIKAQEDMLAQIQSQNITLDVEHSEWYDDAGIVLNKPKNTTIPVAKVVSAELRERGVWIKAEVNRNIPSFRSVWNSIKEGFLKAFSVAFYPVAKAGKEISKLNLVNITLTGSPVNPNATFSVAMKSAKAFLDQQKQEDNTMESELKHKYIRREGSKGKYTYIYKEEKSKSGSSKTSLEDKAKDKIEKLETKQLLEVWELSNKKIDGKNDKDVSRVRGWLMDELEKRDKVGFNLWINSGDDNPDKFFDDSSKELKKKISDLAKDYDKLDTSDFQGVALTIAKEHGLDDDVILDTAYVLVDEKPKTKSFKEADKMSEQEIVKEKVDVQPDVKAEEEVKSEVAVEEKQEVEEPVVEEPNPLEAEVKALKEEVAKLKAELEKPVMKAVKEETPEIPEEEQKFVSPLKLI